MNCPILYSQIHRVLSPILPIKFPALMKHLRPFKSSADHDRVSSDHVVITVKAEQPHKQMTKVNLFMTELQNSDYSCVLVKPDLPITANQL